MATAADLDQLVDLAHGIKELMTTMPRNSERMAERIAEGEASFGPVQDVTGNEIYFFVLEEDGVIVGTSAVYAAVGLDRPFYSYKIAKRSQVSPELDVRINYRVLQPVNDYTGSAEVGTLYLAPEHRGGGRGRLLSLCRFMFIAAHQERFGQRVMAEMRGWTDDSGASPFWDAVGAKFYGLDLHAADLRSGHDVRFIADLLPPYPIFIDLLPEEAQRVVGLANTGSEPAAAMLRRQGFRNNNYVDIFDAGLCLDCHVRDLDTVRRSELLTMEIADEDAPAPNRRVGDRPVWQPAIISTTGLADFRVAQATVAVVPAGSSGLSGSSGSSGLSGSSSTGTVLAGAELAADLQVEPGTDVLVYVLAAKS